MNFRDEITKMNSDKLTIADVDSFIPEILKIAAMLIYKKINNEIVETYRKERNNHIIGHFETGNFKNELHKERVEKKFSKNKYSLNYLSTYSLTSGDNESLKSGLSICADISYSRDKIIDFVDSNGYIYNRPDIRIVPYDYTYRVIIEAYAIQTFIGKRFLKGNEFSFKYNEYANVLTKNLVDLGKTDCVNIIPKIGVCLNSYDYSDNWQADVDYLDSGAYITFKGPISNKFHGSGLIFHYSTQI